ncbi:TLDc domain-containing protein [Psidium guajava]|nr:TLDc domain-containing protein [Psidium guajava]
MGASSSSDQKVPPEQREVESLAASAGALPMLRKAFSDLADPQTSAVPVTSLQRCLSLCFDGPISSAPRVPASFPGLLEKIGPSIVDVFFVAEKGGLSWVEFVKGYVKCCGRMAASMVIANLLRVFTLAANKAGHQVDLQFESDEADCKVGGHLTPRDVLMLLWMCWAMLWSSKVRELPKGKAALYLPDIGCLVLSAVVSCVDNGSRLDLWNFDIFGSEDQLPARKFVAWALATVPTLPDCYSQFVHEHLGNCSLSQQDELEPSNSSSGDITSVEASCAHLLTPGRAWAISLTVRNALREEILRHCFFSNRDEIEESLLYRSSLHGKGLNRFWSNTEGYLGPLLMFVSGYSGDSHEADARDNKWVIGVLLQQGLESRDHFYGSPGNIYAVDPLFHAYLPSGKEKNFVYSHLHPSARVYEPHPKPVGLGFGGTMGNERIFIDEDFARITLRHHAVDKTYQSGPLFPNQGFLPVDAFILEVEVWGLGGTKAKEVQLSFKKRELLFTEQRRKVDLKTFASWEDSPEKMMMDMMNDPNQVQREDR